MSKFMTRHTSSKHATLNLYSNCDIELASLIRPCVGIPTGRHAGPLAGASNTWH